MIAWAAAFCGRDQPIYNETSLQPSRSTRARPQVVHLGVSAAVFVLVFVARWLTLRGLTGDDHWSLWTAATFLKGDVPLRDFVDVGDPLYWGLSALAQWIVGYRAVGEVVLGTTLIALAFTLAFDLAWQASRSLWVAALLTGMALLLMTHTELYSYPKIFVYPLGLWLCWRYVDRPTLARAIGLALGVAIAWGYRHDHGAYVGLGAAVTVLATHWGEGPRRVLSAWARFGAALLVLLAPYVILIQANEGIVQYVLARMDVARQLDSAGRRFVWFTVDRAAPSYWFAIDPPPPARVQVDWKPEVTNEIRIALEQQYSLTNGLDPRPPDGVEEATPVRYRWEYALTNVSRANIRRIVEDPHVFDTGLIERNTHRPMEESWLIGVRRAVPLLRLSIAPRYWHELNAGVCLYYVSLALPFILLTILALDRIRGRSRAGMPHAAAKMCAAAVMMPVANVALLRKLGYISDHANVAAILGACVIGQAMAGAHRRSLAGVLPAVVTGIVLVVSMFATITYVPPSSALTAAGLSDSLRSAWDKSVQSFRDYVTSPPIDHYAPPGSTGDRGLLRYIYECTRPDDRIWLLSETYSVPYYTERRVVGHIYWGMGFLATPEYQRRTIDRVDKEEVPFIMSFGGRRPLELLESYDLVHDYVSRRYTEHYAIPEDKAERGLTIWLLTDSRRRPTGTYELFGLPCFK